MPDIFSNNTDKIFGPIYDMQLNKFYLGGDEVKVDDKGDFILKNKVFPGSDGLYELLFKKSYLF